ncbi:MAG: damage-control phosphatase ARMT1 family protein [Rudaea sp.]
MTPFTIPPFLIDPTFLPAPLMTSEPGSFAQRTVAERIPGIVDDTIAHNHFTDQTLRAVLALRQEITSGVIRPIEEPGEDRDFWNELSHPYIGRSWLDVPWYWAETFFYRRMLEATGYFRAGPSYGVDPYAEKKETEFESGAALRAVAEVLHDATDLLPEEEQFRRLLYATLWGNRVDLSYNVAAALGRSSAEEEQANLLVDDTAGIWRFLTTRPARRLMLIADNAGTELCLDLVLCDWLLEHRLVEEITLHVKAQPLFVSDAMERDVLRGLDALARPGGPALAPASRLEKALADGTLAVATHWFYATSLFYFQMPGDLAAQVASANLVLLKGDANYRRLLGDAHWPFTTRFARVVDYFPAPLVALRTLKAEEIVGLEPGRAEQERAADADWLVNGKRGVVQARL